jgi:hypothetical protein
MNQKIQPTNREEWFSHVNHQRKSGLSCVEYCRQNELNKAQFFYYCKVLRKPKTKSELAPSFTPVISALQTHGTPAEIRIELPNGFRCYIPKQIDLSQLKQLIGILLSC